MIYLVRHGEPAANWGAHPNPSLTELGVRQACATAEALAKAGAKRAITSPLARSRETAARFEKLMETHARIETRVGEIITPKDVEDRSAWLKSIVAVNWTDTDDRLQNWRRDVIAALETLPDETAVFCHFMAINAIVGMLTNDDRVVVFKPDHASITKVERRDGRLVIIERGAEAATIVT